MQVEHILQSKGRAGAEKKEKRTVHCSWLVIPANAGIWQALDECTEKSLRC